MEDEIVFCKIVRKCRTNSQGYCDDQILCGCKNCINCIEEYIPIDKDEYNNR